MKNSKVLMIGGKGYIGSSLVQYLQLNGYNVDVCDIFKDNNLVKFNIDYKLLKKKDLEQYTHIILLAGNSSVKSCEGPFYSSFKNNVNNFVELLDKLSTDITLIYASSSSVYGDSKQNIISENMLEFKPNNYYDLTKYLIDMINLGVSNQKIVGLRFGTVNGISPILRTDVMINAMVNSAIIENHIKLYVKEVYRPILGTNDLNRAIKMILNSEYKGEKFFNLASFNDTADSIANKVAAICNVPIVEIPMPQNIETKINNTKFQTAAYNFSIDTSLFQQKYSFTFFDTVESITKDLISNWSLMSKVSRSIFLNYKDEN
jgi:nucleoside-diphosphate-sugar epimerase